MTFLNPILAAAGLACVAIPIIIHFLMRRRRKPVMWAAMRFLLEAYRQHRRRLRLEQLLLLAARCMVIALIALALGRPLMGAAGLLGGRGAVTLYILIDNGLASSAQDQPGTAQAAGIALDRHKSAATALLEQLDSAAGDRVGLIALGGPAQPLVSPPSSSTSAVRDLINGLTPTDSPTDLAGALGTLRATLESSPDAAQPAGRTLVVILSDFLTGSADTDRKLGELAAQAGLAKPGRDIKLLASRPAERGAPNIAITGLEPLRPVVIASRRTAGLESTPQQSPVRVTLRRTGPGIAEAAATTVRLGIQSDSSGTAPATPGGQAVVRWAPGQTEATAAASIDLGSAGSGAVGGSVVLTASIDSDAIAGDNTWRRPVELRQALRVGVVAPRRTGGGVGLLQFDAADWFRLALQPSDPSAPLAEAEIEVLEIEPGALDAGRLSGLDAAIIARPDILPEGAWRRLRAFADSGGLIIVAPPAQATVHLWTDAMGRDLGLPWTAGREARIYPQAIGLSGDRQPSTGAQPRDMLALLSVELPELVGPVRILRALPVEPAAGAQSTTLLRLTDGSPFLLASPPGAAGAPAPGETAAEPAQRGLVVLIASALAFDWTDLQAKPLMVPLMQEIVRQGVGRARGSWSGLAGVAPEVPPRTIELRPMAAGPAANTVKTAAGRAVEPIRRAGIWRALDDRGASRGIVAINADPAASRSDPQPPAAIAAWIAAGFGSTEVQWLQPAPAVPAQPGQGSLKTALDRGQDQGRLILPLLIAALLMAVVELALARWFSHAIIRPAGVNPVQGAAA